MGITMHLTSLAKLAAFLSALVFSSPAVAELYRVEGEVRDATSSRVAPVSGLIEIDPDAGTFAPRLVSRFAIEAGGGTFIRANPLFLDFEHGGLGLAADDTLEHDGDRVEHFRLTTEVERPEDPDVAFRRATFEAASGRVADIDAETGLPRRFEVEGTLTRSSYASGRCYQLPPLPQPITPSIGSGLEGGDVGLRAGAVISIVQHDFDPGLVVVGDGAHDTAPEVLVSADEISGVVEVAPSVAAPSDATIAPTARPLTAAPPFTLTLEDLGTEAPDGASIEVNADGSVRVEGVGNLYIDSGLIEIDGLTTIEFHANANIIVGPAGISVPQGVDLTLSAGDRVDIGPGDLGVVPLPDLRPVRTAPPICRIAVLLEDREETLAELELRAERITPAEVRVRHGKRLSLRRRARVPVVVMGSDRLDVRDLDLVSLRLGTHGASTHSGRSRGKRSRRRDIDRDGHLDLLVRFRNEDTGIEAGDTSVCLRGRTRGGDPILGCAAIETVVNTKRGAEARRELLQKREAEASNGP
jgi:hypothetical protein